MASYKIVQFVDELSFTLYIISIYKYLIHES